MAKRVLLAFNPRARRGEQARDTARGALEARGHTVTVVELQGPDDLSREIVAHRGRIDVVAVAGGDGTLLGAIEGLRETNLPLLALPLGTINELARTLGIPFDLSAASALLDDGVEFAIDVGRVNGFWFFDEASIGLSTRVARLQTGPVKSRWGMLAIPLATLRALRGLNPYHLDVENERGEVRRIRTVQLTVANSYRFGGVVENPEARIDDGRLDLYAIDVRGIWDILRVLVAVALRRFPKARNILHLEGTRFTVRGHRHTHVVYADGERATATPAEFTVVPKAVRVLVPRERAAPTR